MKEIKVQLDCLSTRKKEQQIKQEHRALSQFSNHLAVSYATGNSFCLSPIAMATNKSSLCYLYRRYYCTMHIMQYIHMVLYYCASNPYKFVLCAVCLLFVFQCMLILSG